MSKNFCQVAGVHRGLPTALLSSSFWSWDFWAGELLMAWACARHFPAAAWRQTAALKNLETPCRAPTSISKNNQDCFTHVGTSDDFHNHPWVELASQNLTMWLYMPEEKLGLPSCFLAFSTESSSWFPQNAQSLMHPHSFCPDTRFQSCMALHANSCKSIINEGRARLSQITCIFFELSHHILFSAPSASVPSGTA